MAIMNYITPGISKIEFEDSIFVLTDVGRDNTKQVQEYIENRGGVVKGSVTKSTNYLIYGDGEEETIKYKKALELVREKGLDIKLLSFKTFKKLIPVMSCEMFGDTRIEPANKTFVFTGFERNVDEDILKIIKTRNGHIEDRLSKNTDYLIYADDAWETQDYLKALEMAQNDEAEINIFSWRNFLRDLLVVVRGESVMEFGSYPFEEDETRKPIKWTVLKRDGNKALLLSAYGLDAKPYNEELKDITWEDCTLRKWLNGEFLNTAFTEEERQRIITTKVKNADNPKYNTPGGNDTEDTVFLLSIGEAKEYLPTNLQRQVAPTPYAVNKGVYKSSYGTCWWWLRSPGLDPYSAAGIRHDGLFNALGYFVNFGDSAVCPAMWVELE